MREDDTSHLCSILTRMMKLMIEGDGEQLRESSADEIRYDDESEVWGEKICRLLNECMGEAKDAFFVDEKGRERYHVVRTNRGSLPSFSVMDIVGQVSYKISLKGDILPSMLPDHTATNLIPPDHNEIMVNVNEIRSLRKKQ